LRRNHKKPKRV